MTSSPRCRSGRGGGTKKVGRSVARRDSVSNPGVTIISLDCGWAVRMDVMLGSRMTIHYGEAVALSLEWRSRCNDAVTHLVLNL